MIPVVISDIHSRKSKLIQLLEQVGVLDHDGNRAPGYQLIQVGDAVSAGYGMVEADFYRWWVDLLEPHDIEIVGNHEAPIMWSYDDRFKFYGYLPGDMGLSGCDPELKVEVLARQDRYQAAYVVDDWLITHAGVKRNFQRGDADETADGLNALWDQHREFNPHPVYSCPICSEDGILWVRYLENMPEARRIKQIFGHTPTGPTLGGKGTMWNIDTKRVHEGKLSRKDADWYGGVAALVMVDGEWELNYVA